MKPVVWLGDSLASVRSFPRGAMREVGYQLERVQSGREPSSWKPMPSIGVGVNEIRVRSRGAFRVIYIAKFPGAVYVLHAFQKKTPKTGRLDTELAKARLRHLIRERREP